MRPASTSCRFELSLHFRRGTDGSGAFPARTAGRIGLVLSEQGPMPGNAAISTALLPAALRLAIAWWRAVYSANGWIPSWRQARRRRAPSRSSSLPSSPWAAAAKSSIRRSIDNASSGDIPAKSSSRNSASPRPLVVLRLCTTSSSPCNAAPEYSDGLSASDAFLQGHGALLVQRDCGCGIIGLEVLDRVERHLVDEVMVVQKVRFAVLMHGLVADRTREDADLGSDFVQTLFAALGPLLAGAVQIVHDVGENGIQCLAGAGR